jgi:hypothetical protein
METGGELTGYDGRYLRLESEEFQAVEERERTEGRD